jgi:hypothetical protein
MAYSKTNRIQDRVQDKATAVQDKVTQWSDAASEAMACSMDKARESVASNPGTAVFTAFGVGLGVGVCMALAFSSRPQSSYDYAGLRDKFTQFMNQHAPWVNG